MEENLIGINPLSTPLISDQMNRCESFIDNLFVQIMLVDDRAIETTYVNGVEVIY